MAASLEGRRAPIATIDEWRGRVGIARPPRNEEWGARTFSVTDPFGNTIFVMGPVSEAQ